MLYASTGSKEGNKIRKAARHSIAIKPVHKAVRKQDSVDGVYDYPDFNSRIPFINKIKAMKKRLIGAVIFTVAIIFIPHIVGDAIVKRDLVNVAEWAIGFFSIGVGLSISIPYISCLISYIIGDKKNKS